MKTLYDIMDESDSCLLAFDKACEQMQESKFILAEKKISALLQTIAGSKKLYAIMRSSTEDYDFAQEFRKIKRDVNGKSSLAFNGMPRKKQIAFVFNLLFSFDTKKIDLQKFVHTYYPSHSVNHEFIAFCADVINTFKKNVIDEYLSEKDFSNKAANVDSKGLAVYGNSKDLEKRRTVKKELKEFEESLSKDVDVYREKPDYTIPNDNGEEYLNNQQIDNMLLVCHEIIGIVARDPSLTTAEREEIMIICEAFEKAIEFGGISSIKIMHIALKNTIYCSKLARTLQLQTESLARFILEYQI